MKIYQAGVFFESRDSIHSPAFCQLSLRPLHYIDSASSDGCDGFEHAESVTLGGAVGSRDLEDLGELKTQLACKHT